MAGGWQAGTARIQFGYNWKLTSRIKKKKLFRLETCLIYPWIFFQASV